MNHLACVFFTLLMPAAAFAAPVDTALALAEKNGCLGCHAVAVKLVGPAYKDVAAKYAGQSDATEVLAKSIRAGGTGKWGEMAMPPQPELSQADAKALATWILGGAK